MKEQQGTNKRRGGEGPRDDDGAYRGKQFIIYFILFLKLTAIVYLDN